MPLTPERLERVNHWLTGVVMLLALGFALVLLGMGFAMMLFGAFGGLQ